MTLTTRVTVFFLSALAAILVAFAATIYVVAEQYLERQLVARSDHMLSVLQVCVENDPSGLEWEPHDRQALPRSDEPTLHWAVSAVAGQHVDGSAALNQQIQEHYASRDESVADSIHTFRWHGADWFVDRRVIRHDSATRVAAEDESVRDANKHPLLVLSVAVAVQPMRHVLNTLAWWLCVIAVVVWTVAALGGRWFCARALAPLDQMAAKANQISPEALNERLPLPPSNDQLRTLAVAFNELLARVQEAFERQKLFTSEASHQLRTPLTAMLGEMEVALRRDRSAEEYREVFVATIAQAERLRQLIEMLLILGRADAQPTLTTCETIEICSWVTEQIRSTWSKHPRYNCIHVVATNTATLNTHPPLLAQGLDNLLDNALKYSPPASLVTIEVRLTETQVQILVQDRGHGIPAVDHDRIFTPFFRTSVAHEQGIRGSGLGLAVTARIVGVLGGQMAFTSAQGQGSCFAIILPLHESK